MATRAIISLFGCFKKTYSKILYREGYNIETFERLYKKQTNKQTKKKGKKFEPKEENWTGNLDFNFAP